MELREAMTQVSEIRAQMARAQVFRGYRSATTAFSGLVALVAAVVQSVMIPEPLRDIAAYLALWVGAAVISMGVVGVEMVIRSRRSGLQLQSQLTLLAVEQFMPSVVAGGLLTCVFVGFVPEALWMLPGLWLLLFALGVFASCRLLPRATFWVGGYYLLAGLLVLVWTHQGHILSPWAMGLPFGVGQLLTAGVLYVTLERGHE